MTDRQESPDYVRISTAAAMTLGLKNGLFYRNARLYCINLLQHYDDGCRANCSYCGLSRRRTREPGRQSFIRVEWPLVDVGTLIDRMRERVDRVKRICLSMITHPRATRDTLSIATRLRNELDIPLSVLLSPTVLTKSDLETLKHIGVDRVGIAVDGATQPIFDHHRGYGVGGPHAWDRYWACFRDAAAIFGERMVGSHLIVGLGETELAMVEAFFMTRQFGGVTHLFSFFPEPGSALERQTPPPMDQYRRMQLARFLIDEGIAGREQFEFDAIGKLVGIAIAPEVLHEVISSGTPFRTSGCPGTDGEVACNRPYANSLPGPDIRNYPFRPDDEDMEKIKGELGLGLKIED